MKYDNLKLMKRGPLAAFGTAALLVISVSMLRSQSRFQPSVVVTDPIVGTWSCVIPPAGGAPQFTVIKSMHVGGTLSEIDNAVPPSAESPTVGTWWSTSPNQGAGTPLTYGQDAYQMSWDPSGNFLGTYHYSGPLRLDSSLSTLSISGTATLIGPDSTIVTSFPFTASCTRPKP